MFIQRLRRNRQSAAIRALTCETRVAPAQLIYPLFVKEGESVAIPTLPRLYRFGETALLRQIEQALEVGICAVALFPAIDSALKDERGSEALNPNNLVHRMVRSIKHHFPSLYVMTDVALDPYTSHGHDGLYDEEICDVTNDATVEVLVDMALAQAAAGSDMVAPSDMMDGRVGAIRRALDAQGFSRVGIHSYAIKYASSFYAPFREAVGATLKYGDKKTYQMNPANSREALRAATRNEEEGADILMVKPAGLYLDIISRLRECTHLPISAYQVSGEYAMLYAAIERGWLDESRALYESILGIRRAGADMILTYAAPQLARWIREGRFE